jgi:hypothetical protein
MPPKNKNARQIAASADTSSPLMTLPYCRILSNVILDYFLASVRCGVCCTPVCSTTVMLQSAKLSALRGFPMDDYAQQWKHFDRLQQKYFVLFCVGSVVVVAALIGEGKLRLPWYVDGPIRGIVIVSYAFVWNGLKQNLQMWQCPRCSKRFSGGQNIRGRWFGWIRLPRQCGHCGLPNGSDPNVP